MSRLIAQTTSPGSLKAIEEQFRQGGSFGTVLVTVLGFVAVLATIFAIDRLQRRLRERPEPNRPRRLFRDLLVRMQLSVPDRDLLRRIADDLQLPHPAVLVLCPEIFGDHARRWRELQPRRSPAIEARLEALAGRLFPGG